MLNNGFNLGEVGGESIDSACGFSNRTDEVGHIEVPIAVKYQVIGTCRLSVASGLDIRQMGAIGMNRYDSPAQAGYE